MRERESKGVLYESNKKRETLDMVARRRREWCCMLNPSTKDSYTTFNSSGTRLDGALELDHLFNMDICIHNFTSDALVIRSL